MVILKYADPASIALLLGGLVTAGAGLMGALTSETNKRTLHRIAWATFVGGLIVVFCGFWAAANQVRSDAEIRELNEKISKSITGGSSFCFLELLRLNDHPNPFIRIPSLKHEGTFPLYDVSITITDLDVFEQVKRDGLKWEEVLSNRRVYQIGNIPPDVSRPIGEMWQLPEKDYIRYNILISARNGFFSQRLRLRRMNGQWREATIVTTAATADAPQVLHKKVDAGFPLNQQGEVDW
jgi:hypothetical protein